MKENEGIIQFLNSEDASAENKPGTYRSTRYLYTGTSTYLEPELQERLSVG